MEIRELYCPSHFGNTYETGLNYEIRELLSEANYWGFNYFSDWFDTIDLYDYYNPPQNLVNMPEALWNRKFSNYRIANELGFNLALNICPNHVFSDQVTDQTRAVAKGKMFGQLVCPSKPNVEDLILGNYRNLFNDFRKYELELKSISAFAYDYGGCACDKCSPWIITFGKLTKSIVEMAKDYFPEITANLIGWWWTQDDVTTFSGWANENAKGFFKSFVYHLPYGEHQYEPLPIPEKCEDRAFVNISYSETEQKDAYNHYGANIAPRRLERTVNFLRESKASGYMAYSEGYSDDINKAILAGLSSGHCSTSLDVLTEYAQKYFGSNPKDWAELLFNIGNYCQINEDQISVFNKLASSAVNSWRVEQIRYRLMLVEIDQKVQSMSKWSPERIALANSFIRTKEKLFRKIWGLGIQRHGFTVDCLAFMPDWYKDYLSLKDPNYLQDQLRFQEIYDLDI